MQPIQFSISIIFGYTVKNQNSSILNNSVKRKYSLNVKTFLFQTTQLSISTQLKYQNSSISSNSV